MDELRAVAAAQGGPFSRAQALAHGFSPRRIRTLLAGPWTALRRGVYVETVLLATDPERRHVVLAAAALLASGRDHAASHRSAALVHALPVLGRPPRVPQLTRPPRFCGDSSDHPGLHVAALDAADLTTVGGVCVTSPARTVSDVARTTSFREGVVAADAALRAGLEDDDLRAAAARCSRWPGGRTATAVAAFADGRTETPLESITRVAYATQGLPPPQTQIELYDPDGHFVALVDFLWLGQRVVGEADGMGKYDAPGAGRLEKQRELRIERCGFAVVRNTWDDAWSPAQQRLLAARVRETFELAARRPVVPGVRVRTPSLAELRRVTEAWRRAA